jgi:tripartite ATP-independent transporter DctM subunit
LENKPDALLVARPLHRSGHRRHAGRKHLVDHRVAPHPGLALALVGHIKGGLGYATIVAACLLAALSGSAVADAAALSTLLLPMMVAAGHEKGRAAGLIASAGIIAPVVPPSIGFVVFGVAANVSISKLFFAGIFPGIMLAATLWLTWWWLARKESIASPARKLFVEVLGALRRAAWALVLPFIIIIGLKMGVFTPTEAGVVAAVYALFVHGSSRWPTSRRRWWSCCSRWWWPAWAT